MDKPSTTLDNETMEKLVSRDLVANVYKNGQYGCYRHAPIDSDQTISSAHAYIDVRRRGDLSSLSWFQSSQRPSLTTSEYETELCSVMYASLNFRDIMLASGKLPPDAIPGDKCKKADCLLGMEFSGRDSQGNRVMGLTPAKGLATTLETAKALLWSVPDHWTLEQAATVPVVYTTAYYALVVRANIQRGNTVLIHSGSGGVGQAAISIAMHYGCKVFTTVGSVEKRDFLKEKFPKLDDSCFFSSRDIEFETGILEATSGKGVDIVLNSLAEEKLQASVRVLAENGKFLEIGKYDLAQNSALGMSVFLKNITFHGILMDNLFTASSQELAMVSKCFTEGIKSGVVRPLNATVFDKNDIEGAFRFMGGGKHIGKVLVKIRDGVEPTYVPALPRSTCDPKKTYVITGGLGGFGLELADWLVNRGARKLILTSRSGIKTGYQRKKLSNLAKRGAEIAVSTKNVCNKEEAVRLFEDIKGSPVGGVFHLAVALNDGLIDSQTQETFQKVCEPKITGTLNLDHVTRQLCKEGLDWFVVFSSASSGYGNAGQVNYGFANSSMERIIEQRKKDGYPGIAIQWGPIGDVGVFIETIGNNDMALNGALPQRITSCFQSLDILMNQSEPVVSSFVPVEKNLGSQSSGQSVVETVCKILGIKNPESLDENKAFGDMGLDSLLAVEVKITLENEYNIVLNPKEIRDLTLKKLKDIAEGKEEKTGEEQDEQTQLAAMFLTPEPNTQLLPTEIIRKMNDIETGTPMFIVHHAFGTVLNLDYVVSQLKIPVYAIQRTKDVPLDSFPSMATCYINAIQEITQGQSFHLAGYSFGAGMAQEMALQLQQSNSNFKSLILLDGSHLWVPLTVKDARNADDVPQDVEIQALKMVFDALEIDLKDANVTEEKIQKSATKISTIQPDVSLEDAMILCRGVYCSHHLAANYKPDGQYHGDVTLIAAEGSRQTLPELGEDYGLREFCTGQVSVHTIPGRHVSYLKQSSGDQVASIINNTIST